MALDSLDLYVVIILAAAVAVYYSKTQLFAKKETSGFLNAEGSGLAGGLAKSRNIFEVMEKNDKNSLLLFGSQTGTAEDYCHKMSRELSSRFGLKTMVADFADYDWDKFDEIKDNILVFFLMATYGEGEPTDNAIEFIEYLENEADTLSNLRFTVFGLGNSTYEFYNAIGRKLNQSLEEKGAERFAPYGEGDDGKGTLDEDFLTWKDEVFDSLRNNLDMEEKELKYEPSVKLTERDDLSIDNDNDQVSLGEPTKKYITATDVTELLKGPFDHTHPYLAPICHIKELFNSKERSCVHVEFDLSDSNLKYSTGDHLAIWPQNCNENISSFVKAFGLEAKRDTVYDLKTLDTTYHIPFPTPITYEATIRHHLEISGPISRQFFLSVAGFAPDEATKERVTSLATDKVKFAEVVTHKKYNIADALLHVSNGKPWTQVPFEFLIENIQHLTPRYYSISSSSLCEKNRIHITAVVESELESDSRLITGVVTNHLKNIELVKNKSTTDIPIVHYDLEGPRHKFHNFKLPVHVRRSTFKLPSSTKTPIILVGPGTGVAPLRGFVRERVQQVKNGMNVGPSVLFYGCRNENEDYLYKEEWKEYAKILGSNFELNCAFSRAIPGKKVYVQEKILEQAKRINHLLQEEGAIIYVCGDASHMARDVQASFVKVISEERGIELEKAAELVRSLKVQNRYQEDVW
ncbi:cprA [Candida oxycetoniae]|uniref:NADPH--cytochrome P450 reductase n=1 Tax=Candida oxycetoniae TaxID=497107 RepID=A0AAI9WZT6_9ASCO|nr:cprA [Candida oxycetoniae]KAI3406712.1 cprA [Candida oxycetoniae]